MPKFIGQLHLPRKSPNFLALRVAVRPFIDKEVTIGLSGGPDSLALLAAACAEGAQVNAICVDHNLQEGSRDISEKAAEQARFMGAKAVVVSIDVPIGQGTEAAAREARYDAFSQITDEIWVGHTMDDQAETFLLGGLRGNPTGMRAISYRPGLKVVRPMLSVRRANTHRACTELGVQPWTDPHNSDSAFRRVAVRNRVIPLLAEIHSGDPVPGLALAAGRAAMDEEWMEGVVEKRRSEWAEGLPVALASEPAALRHRMIADFLRSAGGVVSSRSIRAVDQLLVNWHGQGGVAVGKTAYGRLEVVRQSGKLRVTG